MMLHFAMISDKRYLRGQAVLEHKENMRYGGAMRGRGQKQPRISVTLSGSEDAELQALAEKHQVAKSWVGRRAIQEFLDKYRNEEMQLPLKLSRGGRE